MIDISTLLDKNGGLSARRLIGPVLAELIECTPWLPDTARPAERLWNVQRGHSAYTKFCHCGKPIISFASFTLGYHAASCSPACAPALQNRIKITPAERAKREQERLECRSTSVQRQKAARLKTNLVRYGTAFPWDLPELQAERRTMKLLKFAEAWIAELKTESCTALFTPEQYTSNRIRHPVRCDLCSTEYELDRFQFTCDKGKTCPTCYTKRSSRGQHEMNDWIRTLDVQTRLNDRKVFRGKFEIDIFVAEHDLAIEYDGLYWHSEKGRPEIKVASLAKFEALEAKGLRTLMFFEDEWAEKKEICQNMIKDRLGLPMVDQAELMIREVMAPEQREFIAGHSLREHQLGELGYGIWRGAELLAVVLFSRESEHMMRVTCVGQEFPGLAKRIMESVLQEHPGIDLTACSDNRISTDLYSVLGFMKINRTPQEFFMIDASAERLGDQTQGFRVWDLGSTEFSYSRAYSSKPASISSS